jgi:hypothetical protein
MVVILLLATGILSDLMRPILRVARTRSAWSSVSDASRND